MNAWLAFCLSWNLGQPMQLHVAGGRYDMKLPVVGIVRGPLNFEQSSLGARSDAPAQPMAAFLAQCR